MCDMYLEKNEIDVFTVFGFHSFTAATHCIFINIFAAIIYQEVNGARFPTS